MGELKVTGNGEFLKFLLPSEDLNEADIAALKYLVLKFPYCQSLHFAYLSALKQHSPAEYEGYLPKAALYAPKREVLHRYIHDPGSFYNHGLREEQSYNDAENNFAAVTEGPGQETETAPVETVIPAVEHLIEEVNEVTGPEPEEILIQEETEVTDSQDDESKGIEVESIASSDYFIFNRSEIDPLKEEEMQPAVQTENADPEDQMASEVTKYDDDTMPYTFLWWLHKTRKEYAETYQPFVRNPHYIKRTPAGELNQQIIENIFHIQPELNTFQAAEVATTVEFELKRKEDQIIEKFIQEEPQIRPPQANKLDNENKARKSSEDHLDLVSETLAKIYTDQMLYHKAIEIYKKLSLKFPDKKLYFAGQIEELEKKIS